MDVSTSFFSLAKLDWPQIVLLVVWAWSLLANVLQHGDPKGHFYNAYWEVLRIVLMAWLLWQGGFFSWGQAHG